MNQDNISSMLNDGVVVENILPLEVYVLYLEFFKVKYVNENRAISIHFELRRD